MAFPTTPTIDQFNRTENPLSDNGRWTNQIITGDANLQTDGTALAVTDTTTLHPNSAYRNDQDYGPDCEVYGTVKQLTVGPSSEYSLFLRLQGTGLGSGTPNGYEVNWRIRDHTIQSDDWRVFRFDAGVRTQIGVAAQPANVVQGDVLGGSMVGSTITMYQNGVSRVTQTDTTYPAAGKIGIESNVNSNDSTPNPLWDDFGGGTIALYGHSTALKPLWKPQSYTAIFQYLQNIGDIAGASTPADPSGGQWQVLWAYDTKYESTVRRFFLQSLQNIAEPVDAPPLVPDVAQWRPMLCQSPKLPPGLPGLYFTAARDDSAPIQPDTVPEYTPRPITLSRVPGAVFFYLFTHEETSQSVPSTAQNVGRVTGLEHRPRHWPGIIR